MRIAFLADIHGNLPALEAVAEDLKLQSPDAVFLVGDQVNRCPWSNEVLDLLADAGWQGIRGNHEVVLTHVAQPHDPSPFDNQQRYPDVWWTLDRLSALHKATIAAMPDELTLDLGAETPLRLVHGVPGDPFRGFFVDTTAEEIGNVLEGVQEATVVCGHTHRPLHRTVEGQKVLNGGSVGFPYNGDPRAQYLLLSSSKDGWTPTFRRVEYPIRAVYEVFSRGEVARSLGPLARIYLRSIATASPWISDFGYWLNVHRSELQNDLEQAVVEYERTHGPGRWSFVED